MSKLSLREAKRATNSSSCPRTIPVLNLKVLSQEPFHPRQTRAVGHPGGKLPTQGIGSQRSRPPPLPFLPHCAAPLGKEMNLRGRSAPGHSWVPCQGRTNRGRSILSLSQEASVYHDNSPVISARSLASGQAVQGLSSEALTKPVSRGPWLTPILV